MTAPTNRKTLQRLLGLMQYFRRHVANYSVRTYHMRQLLKQDTKFTWTQDCQNELEDIKHALTNAPILAPFRNDRKVYLYTDGSVAGMGAVALQFDDQNHPQIGACMSIASSEAQKKWHSYQLEMYAIAMALRQNETFFSPERVSELLLDRTITLRYDYVTLAGAVPCWGRAET